MLIKLCDAINKPVSSAREKSLQFVLTRSPAACFLLWGVCRILILDRGWKQQAFLLCIYDRGKCLQRERIDLVWEKTWPGGTDLPGLSLEKSAFLGCEHP